MQVQKRNGPWFSAEVARSGDGHHKVRVTSRSVSRPGANRERSTPVFQTAQRNRRLTEFESDNLGNIPAVRRFLSFKDPDTSLPPGSELVNYLPPRVFKIGHSHRSLVAHHSVRPLSSDMNCVFYWPLIPTAFMSKRCFRSWSFPF